MMEILQTGASLGVGAFLGTLMFVMYRADRKHTEDRLSSLLKRDMESREQNTKVLTELVTLITRLNGRLKD